MSIEENLKLMIIERYGTMLNFATAIDMSTSTLSTILNRGVHNANIHNVIKICNALDISVDELAFDRIVPNKPKQAMTDLDYIIALAENNTLTLHGKKLSEQQQDMLLRFLKYYAELFSINKDGE